MPTIDHKQKKAAAATHDDVEAAHVTADVAANTAASQRARRQRQGKARRQTCPRSRHADVILGQGERDALALIEASDQDRLAKLLPVRFTRMAESPFAFFRGSALVQAHDLQGTPSAGLQQVQCCGDCHLMNFGGFATPERALVFDITDFDETLPGPFEWDVKRLATSCVLAARWLGLDADDARRSAVTAVASYRTTMARLAAMSGLDIWYAKVTMDEVFKEYADDRQVVKLLKRSVDKALHSTTEHVLHSIATVENGTTRINDQPPLLFHPEATELDMAREVRPFFANYRASLPRDRRALFDRFEVIDVVHKVVGVGSVGTPEFRLLSWYSR